MALHPSVTSPFPVYLKENMHTQIAEDAWPAAAFWEKLWDIALMEFTSSNSGQTLDEQVSERQLKLICSKIMILCQDADKDSAPAKLTLLHEEYFLNYVAQGIHNQKIKSMAVKLEITVLRATVDLSLGRDKHDLRSTFRVFGRGGRRSSDLPCWPYTC